MSLNPWRPARRGPWWLLSLAAVAALHVLVGLILLTWLERPPATSPGQSVAVDILPLPPEALARQKAQADAEAALLPVPDLPPLPIPDLPPDLAVGDEAAPTGPRVMEVSRGNAQAASRLCANRAVPAVNGLGVPLDAEITVQGTVRGGRVVAVQVLSQRGVPDGAAQRAFAAAVDAALRTGYRCAADGVFEQGFVVRAP